MLNQSVKSAQVAKGDYRQFGEYGVAFEVLDDLEKLKSDDDLVNIRILSSNTLDMCKLSDILNSDKVA